MKRIEQVWVVDRIEGTISVEVVAVIGKVDVASGWSYGYQSDRDRIIAEAHADLDAKLAKLGPDALNWIEIAR